MNLKFSLEKNSNEGINSFSRGHLVIDGSYGVITSINQVPNQSMMVFLSIIQLLDETRSLINSEQLSSILFVGTDTSFQFYIKRQNGIISLEDRNQNVIDRLEESHFIEILWQGIEEFIEKYINLLKKEIVYEDLIDSMRKFKQEFYPVE